MTTDDRRDELTALIEAAVPPTMEETDAVRGLRRTTAQSHMNVVYQLVSALDRGDVASATRLVHNLRRLAEPWPEPDWSEMEGPMTFEEFYARFWPQG
jgi:hypothetical protein